MRRAGKQWLRAASGGGVRGEAARREREGENGGRRWREERAAHGAGEQRLRAAAALREREGSEEGEMGHWAVRACGPVC